MGKRIRAQRKGVSRVYRVASHRFPGASRLPKANDQTGTVTELVHSPVHTAPLARVTMEDGEKTLLVAAEGLSVGEVIAIGDRAALKPGNVTYLKNIPEGTPIHNVEMRPGDGGRIARSGGSSATLETRMGDKVRIRMPSGRLKDVPGLCRASIGVLGGHGREDKPMMKAGAAHYRAKARGKRYPSVSGVKMNPVNHPHGGGNHQAVHGPNSVARGAPPGKKVGNIAPSRTGRKRGKQL